MKAKQIKSNIFYARSFRHLIPDYKKVSLYFFLCVLPCIIIYLFTFSQISYSISNWVIQIIYGLAPGIDIGISYGEFIKFFGGVYYVTLPSKLPTFTFIIINLLVSLLLLLIFSLVRDHMKPVGIYATIALIVHLVSCIFFLLWFELFPYTLSEYSELYMQQQIGIWLSFILIAGLVSGFISHSGISKYVMMVVVILYAFIFGCLRYVVFLVFLYKASSLYMAVLFFSFGPFFDFLYLVCIYSIYINNLTIKFHDKKRGAEWDWA